MDGALVIDGVSFIDLSQKRIPFGKAFLATTRSILSRQNPKDAIKHIYYAEISKMRELLGMNKQVEEVEPIPVYDSAPVVEVSNVSPTNVQEVVEEPQAIEPVVEIVSSEPTVVSTPVVEEVTPKVENKENVVFVKDAEQRKVHAKGEIKTAIFKGMNAIDDKAVEEPTLVQVPEVQESHVEEPVVVASMPEVTVELPVEEPVAVASMPEVTVELPVEEPVVVEPVSEVTVELPVEEPVAEVSMPEVVVEEPKEEVSAVGPKPTRDLSLIMRRLEEIKNEREKMFSNNAMLIGENDSLRTKVSTMNEELDETKSLNSELSKKIEILGGQLSDIRNEYDTTISSLKSELSEKEKMVIELREVAGEALSEKQRADSLETKMNSVVERLAVLAGFENDSKAKAA